MESPEVEKAKTFIVVEIIEYVPNSVLIKTIIKKTTGNVSAVSFDTGEALAVKTSPFDTFIQIIEGKAEIIIDDAAPPHPPPGQSTPVEPGRKVCLAPSSWPPAAPGADAVAK